VNGGLGQFGEVHAVGLAGTDGDGFHLVHGGVQNSFV
jgi:hypothetical protein